MIRKGFLPAVAGVLLLVGLGGCGGEDGDRGPQGEQGPPGPTAEDGNFRMQLLHFADIDGAGGLADVRNFSALVDGFRTAYPESTVLVSAGDNLIPGPEFFAAGESDMADVLGEPGAGRANIAWLNALGVQASVIGNHDLDAGTEDFAELIGADGLWSGARFPHLATNIDYAADPTNALVVADGERARSNSIAGSVTVVVNGERVGLVGASVPTLPSITDVGSLSILPAEFDPAVDADLDALAAEIQPTVDSLADDGIDKIILLAHMQQIAIEKALAERLEHVDVIVAGGSNTLLADANDRLREGDTAAAGYPLEFTSPAGEPVLVVNTAGDFRYLGRLVLEFDDNGTVLTDSIDSGLSGAWATDVVSIPFSPIDSVANIANTLEIVLRKKDGNILGITDVYLDGRRGQVRTRETNLGNLTADANLWLARQEEAGVDISVKNGGGIRNPIGRAVQPAGSNDPADVEFLPPAANDDIGKPEGGISQLDIETSLRFNNGLTLLTVTAAELADIMEHSVAATEPDATPGQFPQVAGMHVVFDPARDPRDADDTNQADPAINGDRLRTLEILDADGNVVDTVVDNGMVQGNTSRTFRLVILDFIAKCVGANTSCGDGYPLNGLSTPNRLDLTTAGTDPDASDFADAGSEQDAMAEYLLQFHADAANAFDQPMDVNQRITKQ